jgi:hypothetical protein
MISRENYEIWIIDYLDGKLNSDQVGSLFAFLEAHPDIYEEFQDLDQAIMPGQDETFDSKEELLKDVLSINEEELDMLLARKSEGDLSESEEALLAKWLKVYPEVVKTRDYFGLTMLSADSELSVDKSSLLIPSDIDYSDLDNLLVGRLEGDISADQNATLEQIVSESEEVKRESGIYARLHLAPDLSLIFQNKESLLKTRVIPMWVRYSVVAVAACMILVLGIVLSSGDPQVANAIELSAPSIDGREVVENEIELPLERAFNAPDVQVDQVADVKESKSDTESEYSKEHIALSEIPVVKASQLKTTALSPELVADYRELQPMPTKGEFENPPASPQGKVILDAVKSGLWGSDSYPDDNYLLALAEKGVSKYSDNKDSDMALEVSGKESQGTFFKIGRFEYRSTKPLKRK